MPRIAIPVPTSFDPAYNQRNWPAFADAVRSHGAEPVSISLDLSPRAIAELANTCAAVLLPSSPADVNPAKYGEARAAATAPTDLLRENVDELLLQDAHNLFKPILGVCFGAQILNVWRSGTLLQNLPTLPLDHAASPSLAAAHDVLVPAKSLLGSAVDRKEAVAKGEFLCFPVNSSHHQAIGLAGNGLHISARSVEDQCVEAIEGPQHDDNAHFVLGVQWHPERTTAQSGTSRNLFARLVREAEAWSPRTITTSVVA